MVTVRATKRLQPNDSQQAAFNYSSPFRPANSFAMAFGTMGHYWFSPIKLNAVARVGRDVRKVCCEGYSTDNECRQHSDDDD